MSEVYEHDKPPFVINGGVDNDASREYEDASKVVIDLDAHTPSETSPVIKSCVIHPVGLVRINVEEEQVCPSAGCSGGFDAF